MGREYLRRDVLGIVDDLRRAEAGDLGVLLLGVGGRDDVRSRFHGELDDLVSDAAGGARDEHDVTGRDVSRVECVDRRGAGEAQRRGGGEVDAIRQLGKTDCHRHGDVLAEGAVAEVRLRHYTEYAVTDSEPVDVGADGFDRAREVLAQHHGEAVLHHPVQVAVSNGEVEPVLRMRRGRGPAPRRHPGWGSRCPQLQGWTRTREGRLRA